MILRSGVRSPASVAGCQLWLNAALSPISVENTNRVLQWNDLSGNNRHAYSAIGSVDRPTYAAAAVNNRPALLFDGTANYMYISGWALPTSSSYLVVAVRQTQTSGGSILRPFVIGYGASNTGPYVTALRADAANADAFYGSWVGGSVNVGTTAGSLPLNTPAVCTGTIVTGGAINVWAGGGNQGSATPTGGNSAPDSNTSIGGQPASGVRFFKGYIAEVAVWNRILSTTERRVVEWYASKFWGINCV